MCQRLPIKEFEKQYKDHLSGFREWDHKDHAEEWLRFEQNLGEKLAIDEVAITNGELYTVITNKAAHGKKGALVAMVEGTTAPEIAGVLEKIPLEKRNTVKEVTLDMSPAMEAIVRASFPRATLVTDRFHVQQLVSEAVQAVRMRLRRDALKEENDQIKLARQEKRTYHPVVFENGDTKKQLLARSRYVLFVPTSRWSERQATRATLLFHEYPELKKAYHLSMRLRSIYEHSHTRPEAKERLRQWYQKVEESAMDAFLVPAESIRLHETTILNYFINRSTNASAESFNAKLKGFRAVVRGVRDVKFFLFRLSKIYG